MTNPDLTLIAALIDRSGSMASIKDDTEGGFAAFLQSQRDDMTENQKIEVWLSEFDNEYSNVYSAKSINDVPNYCLHPRGMTALVDSMYRMISEIGAELEGRDEDARPGKVIFLTLTDGQENSSREVTAEQLREKVKEQTDKYGWQFIFLGANIDAVSVGGSYGIAAHNSMSYTASAAGVDHTFRAASRYTTALRSNAPAAAKGFTDEERDAAMDSKNSQ